MPEKHGNVAEREGFNFVSACATQVRFSLREDPCGKPGQGTRQPNFCYFAIRPNNISHDSCEFI
jgi:hypothetical protein